MTTRKKKKYYCDLDSGRTKGDNLDIYTLRWIENEIARFIKPTEDIHRYSPILRIISDVMNREIGT